MYFRKVTIAAIFICQLTLVPETLMSNNQAIFHVAINSLKSISENCSDKSTYMKKTYSQAISDLTSVFYQQNEKITELEVDNVHLKDEIEYLKDELSKNEGNLHMRIKREPRYAEYKQWPGFPSPNRKRKKPYDQEYDNLDNGIMRLEETRNHKVLARNQERTKINRLPDVPYVMQRMKRNDLEDRPIYRAIRGLQKNQDLRQEVLPTNIQHSGHHYGFYDAFNVLKPNKEISPILIKTRNKPLPNLKTYYRVGDPIDPSIHVKIIDQRGKLIPDMIIVHPGLPDGGMCQIIQNKTKDEKEEGIENKTKEEKEEGIEEPEQKDTKTDTENEEETQTVSSDELEKKRLAKDRDENKVNINYVAPNTEEEEAKVPPECIEVTPKPNISTKKPNINVVRPTVSKLRKPEHKPKPSSSEGVDEVNINFLKPKPKETLDENDIEILYVGGEGDSQEEDKPYYWIYDQDGGDRFSVPEWDYGPEEMVLDKFPDGSNEEEVIPDILEEPSSGPLKKLVPGGILSETPDGGESGTPCINTNEPLCNDGMAFTSTFYIPSNFHPPILRPTADQSQKPELLPGMNVYGNLILLSMQKPELLPSSEGLKMLDDPNITSGKKETS